METNASYDFTTKLITIGDSTVGKTSLLIRFCEDYFWNSYNTTIGVDFKFKIMKIDNKRVKVQIWDTGCQERFSNIVPSFYKNASGIILCYAIDNRESFEHINKWIEQVECHGRKDVHKILVATKSDKNEKRLVAYQEGKKLADQHGMKFLETSSKENINVEEVFFTLVKEIKDKIIIEPIIEPVILKNGKKKIKKKFKDWLDFCLHS